MDTAIRVSATAQTLAARRADAVVDALDARRNALVLVLVLIVLLITGTGSGYV